MWAVLALVAWLDRDGCVGAQQANIFGAIWSAIQWLGGVMGFIGAGIAATVEAAVVYLGSAFGWLATRVADILYNTGAMFAKVWEGARALWTDVLKPALLWLKDLFDRVKAWLQKFFKPVFDFLKQVRCTLKDLYDRFVKPILDGLEIAHVVLKTLGDFGVAWARKLDQWVTEASSVITENWLRLTGWVVELQTIVYSVVTPDRLFQRLPFLSTLERDAGYWIRIWWHTQVDPHATPAPGLRSAKKLRVTDPATYGKELGAFYRDGSGAYATSIAALVPEWRKAAGLDASAVG